MAVVRLGKEIKLRKIQDDAITYPMIQELQMNLEEIEKGGYDHFMQQGLADAQDDTILGTNTYDSPRIFDRLGSVFDLKDAAVRRKGRRREIVARTGGCHFDCELSYYSFPAAFNASLCD